MLINFPPPPPGQTGTYLARLLTVLKQAFASVVSSQQATQQIILRAENGNNYSVTVSNTGTLTVTQV